MARLQVVHDKLYADNQLGPAIRLMPTTAATTLRKSQDLVIDGPFAEPSISFFLNDVDTSRSRGMLKELFDIERVEVAKGPQGTLYGRGSQIGAVAVVTRRPDLTRAGWSVEGQYGSYNLYSLTGMANIPIIEDELGLRVSARRREREGYMTNLAGGKKLNDDDLWAARASLRWAPSADLTFDLILDHQADNDAAAATKAINIASPGGDTDWFSDAGQNRYQPPQKRRQTGATLLADWDFAEGWNLKSISAWREVDFSEAWDVDGTTYQFLIGRNLADDQSILSQEFRLAYDNGGSFRAVGGASFYKDKTFNQSEFVINEQLLLAGFPRGTTPVTRFPVPGTSLVLPVTTGNSTLAYRLLRAQGAKELAPLYSDALKEPGLKTLHVADVDFRSSCPTFRLCLQQMRSWSDANPRHSPVFVLIEPKFGALAAGVPGAAKLDPFDAKAFAEMDASITEIIGREKVVAPDDLRGRHETLEKAALAGAWPTVGRSRGKFVFLMIVPGMNLATFKPYLDGRPNLEGRMAFVQGEPGMAHAAFAMVDNALTRGDEIRDLVKSGRLVRTRSDIDTYEARRNDVKRRDAALASGAQIISTDYPWAPNIFGNHYAVRPFDDGFRCNRVADGTCP